MRDAIFYTALVGFLSGVLLRSFFIVGIDTVIWLLFLAVGSLLLIQIYRSSQYTKQVVIGSVFIVAAALGVLRLDWHEATAPAQLLTTAVDTTITLTGVIARDPDVRTNSQHLYLRETEHEIGILVIVDRYQAVSYGDRVQITGVLSRPESFTTDFGRTFNYPQYLKAQRVDYMIRYPDTVLVTDTEQGNWFITRLLDLKHAFQTSLGRSVSDPHVRLAEGLLLGEKQALGAEWNELFRRTGVIHIVVLSGFNVMLVVAFMLFVLSYVTSLRGRAIGGIIGIICFALIVGLSATVVRASIMASLMLIGIALGRSYAIFRALLLAGVIMIAINPYLLAFDPGFQLSFLATLGLIIVAPHFEALLTLAPKAIGIRGYIVATIATQIAVLPLLLYQIGEFSLVAILVNVLVLPAVPVAMGLTFATGVLGYVWPILAQLVGVLTYITLQYILVVVQFIGSWPLAAFVVPPFPFVFVVVAYGAMGWCWFQYGTRPRLQSDTPKPAPKPESATQSVDTLADWTIVEVRETNAGLVRSTSPAKQNIFIP